MIYMYQLVRCMKLTVFKATLSDYVATFPHPGGPQKIKEGTSPDSRMVRRIAFFPTTLSCPTYSSMDEGLMSSARGLLSSLGEEMADFEELPDSHLD